MVVQPSPIHRPRPIWTLALTAIAFFMVALDALVVVTALPAIQRDLHASLSTLEWTVNAFTLAFAAGIITAAALGDRLGRRRIFTLGLTLFTIASAACALAPTAGLLVAARAVAIVWGLIRSGDVGWGSAQVVASLIGGVILVASFLAWEWRATDPMLPLRLFGSRSFAAANLTGFLMAGSIFSAAFLMSQYFQFALGYSPLATGLRLLPWTATPLLIAPLAGVVSDRVGARPVLALGLLLQCVGLA